MTAARSTHYAKVQKYEQGKIGLQFVVEHYEKSLSLQNTFDKKNPNFQ